MVYRSYYHQYNNTGRHINNLLVRIELKNVKWSRYRHGVAQRMGRGVVLLFHDRGTGSGWVVSSTPRPLFPPEKTRYPFYRRLDGPQCRSGRSENLFPTGTRSRTVQPVTQSLYRLSYRAHVCIELIKKNNKSQIQILLKYLVRIFIAIPCNRSGYISY